VLARLGSLRQHQRDGQRSPHKPLLVLLALGRLAVAGSSELPWTEARAKLADLIAEFGPSSRTGRAQSAAYPFTRLRTDGIWVLDQDVPMDLVGPLARARVNGRFEESAEAVLLAKPALIGAAARDLVLSSFPATVAPDVLEAVGLDPIEVLGADDLLLGTAGAPRERRRDPGWRFAVLEGLGPAVCILRIRRADHRSERGNRGGTRAVVRLQRARRPGRRLGAMCIASQAVRPVSAGTQPAAAGHRLGHVLRRTLAGRAVYDLHGHQLAPRPGTAMPAPAHVTWHTRQVFKGKPLAA